MRNSQPPRTDGVLSFPFNLGPATAGRAAIGLIVLASDQTIEHEFQSLTSLDGVAVYQSRIFNESHITPKTLKAMESRITDATTVLLPGVPLDIVAYCCTSASIVIGEDRVFEQIRKARPEVVCTTPITAAFAAFKALKAERVALLTPYRDDVNRAIQDYLSKRGLEIASMGSFHEEDDRNVCRIAEESIIDAAIALGEDPTIDAVFISCTGLRTIGAITKIETALGKPITSSNHALAWHCLRLAAIDDPFSQRGRLYELGLV